MKKLILFLILFPSIVFAESEITFTAPGTLYTEVQKGISCQKQFILQAEKLQIAEDIVLNLEKENAASIEQLEIFNKKINALSELKNKQDSSIGDLTNLLQTQKEGYEKIIKNSQPSFWGKVKNNTLWASIGFIAGTVTTAYISR